VNGRSPEPAVEPVPSPCNSICTMDPVTGWCLGCRRSLDEIAGWSVMNDADKLAVWDQLAAREVGA
jgi:predicted Fe-S protein YdhL (DUF1289 family)